MILSNVWKDAKTNNICLLCKGNHNKVTDALTWKYAEAFGCMKAFNQGVVRLRVHRLHQSSPLSLAYELHLRQKRGLIPRS